MEHTEYMKKQTHRDFIIILTQFYKARNENEENKIKDHYLIR